MDGKESLYYGLNALSNNLIMVDRKKLKNPNGLILGTPGSGKVLLPQSVRLRTRFLSQTMILSSATRKASTLRWWKRLDGQVIHITPGQHPVHQPDGH